MIAQSGTWVRWTAAVVPVLIALALPALAQTPTVTSGPSAGGDWPTVHHDVARSAYTTDSPAPPFRQKWVWTGAVLENIDTWAEVIVAGDKVFVGTYAGNLYALDRATGKVKWTYPAGNLIVGSPAVSEGVVYVGSLGDLARPGYIHAVDAQTGQGKWKFPAPGGFWTSPCVYKGLVLMGARDGVFYAVDVKTGKSKWKYETPRPILTTAAAKDDMVLFASENGRGYCLNPSDGALKWKSDSLLAITMRGYYPMIWGDTALFVTMPAILMNNNGLRDQGEDMLGQKIGGETQGVRSEKWKKKAVAGVPPAGEVEKERQAILDWLKEDPRRQAAWALKLTDGKPKFMVPIIWHAGNMGMQNAGCVTPDGWFATAAASYFNNWRADQAYGPVRVNYQDGRLEILNWATKDPKATPGFGTTFEYDEAYNFTAGGQRIYFTHQDNLWGLDLKGNVGFNIAGERDKYGGIYGGFNSPFAGYLPTKGGVWLEVNGVKVYSSANQWHGTGQGTLAICGQELFWVTGGMVICMESGPAAGKPAEKLVVGPGPSDTPQVTVPPAKEPTAADIDALLTEIPAAPATLTKEAQPLAEALNQHVEQMLAAGDLMPLVCPTGAATVYAYNHPRETFRCLATAMPYLKPKLRENVGTYLKALLAKTPPTHPSYLSLTGAPRVAGGAMDIVKPGTPTSNTNLKPYQGMYALWAYCHFAQQKAVAEQAWPVVKSAADQAVGEAARFCQKAPSKSAADNSLPAMEANELINGLVGVYRLGVMTGHAEDVAKVKEVLLALVKERVNFPVANAQFWGRTDPALWYSLTPELARLLGTLEGEKIKFATNTPGMLMGFVTEKVDFSRKNFWHLAWGEGLQTSEQAMLYPQYPLALFQLRAFIYQDKPEDLAHYADIPWCTGDLYYIEKLADTLWVYGGRNWETLK